MDKSLLASLLLLMSNFIVCWERIGLFEIHSDFEIYCGLYE